MTAAGPLSFASGGGLAGAQIRLIDWTQTPIGNPAGWPNGIRSIISTILSSPQPMFLAWGPELTLFFNSAYAETIAGRRVGAIGKPIALQWVDIWPEIKDIVTKALSGEGTFHQNLPLTLRRDGEPEQSWWSFSYSPLRDDAGAIIGLLCVAMETTGHITAQLALQAGAARQTFRVELSDALRGANDQKTLIAIASRSLGQHLNAGCVGYCAADSAAEFVRIEQGWTAEGATPVMGTYRLDDFGIEMSKELRNGHTVVIEDVTQDRRTMGRVYERSFASIGTRAIIDVPLVKDGQLQGILFALNPEPRAWTKGEVQMVEEVAERAWVSLQRLGVEAALRQSQKMEAVGQLTGGLAHDFNNLLTVISGSLEMLALHVAEGGFDDTEHFIIAAQGAANRAAALTHRLLAFSRRQTLDPKPTNPNRLVGDMEDLVRRTIGPHIELEIDAAPDLWPVLADPNQLENALLNLCINARDAMPDGGRLTIETTNIVMEANAADERDMAPGNYVRLRVTDTGIGMSPDIIAHAFEPFFTTKPIGVGTGLGLSMIYGFAKQSGGQVRIHSQVGLGTAVSIYLPRHGTAASRKQTIPLSTISPQARPGETVLIVDDEPGVRTLMLGVLKRLGYIALDASDGASALKILGNRAVRIDLLVTDVGMPGMNGRQLADAARQIRPSLDILFITGHAETIVMGDGQFEPGMYVLTKPFALQALADRVTTIIGAN